MKKPYHECPSFEVCSCNVCPLDPDSGSKEMIKGEEACRAHKNTRHRIGIKYAELLQYQGLTKREWVGKKRWENMTDAQKDTRRQVAAKAYSKIKKMRIKPIVEDAGKSGSKEQTKEEGVKDEGSALCQSFQER